MTESRKLRVFLCHASEDKPIVRELYQRLNAEGWIDPWLDKEKLLPGQDWEFEIEKSVESTDAVIVFLSNGSILKEGYFQKELRKVLDIADEKPEGIIFIIPIRLDDCPVPRRLQKWHYVDYFPLGNKELAYDEIVASLRIRATVLNIAVEETEIRNGKKFADFDKEILFHLKTDSRSFIDWYYQNYYYKDLPKDKQVKMPLKASSFFYKPIGPYRNGDPIPIIFVNERNINGNVYKGTIHLEIETISLSPNPRISVTMKFDEDGYFLVFYRMLVGIAKVFRESRELIMPYLEKHRMDYEAINPDRL